MEWNSCILCFEIRDARLREDDVKGLGRSRGLGALDVHTLQVWEVLLGVNAAS